MLDTPLPSQDEMFEATEVVRKYCIDYQGVHQEVLGELGQRLSQNIQLADLDAKQRRRAVEHRYLDAISTLLLLATPPNQQTLKQTLKELSDLTGVELSDVRVFDTTAPGERESHLLSTELPKSPRRRSAAERSLLGQFQAQLHAAADWPDDDAIDQQGGH
nr:hypothetical protein [uncultured Duganella sp.]